MVELFILILFVGSLLIAHVVGAIIWKIKTHSKKSLLEIIDEF